MKTQDSRIMTKVPRFLWLILKIIFDFEINKTYSPVVRWAILPYNAGAYARTSDFVNQNHRKTSLDFYDHQFAQSPQGDHQFL